MCVAGRLLDEYCRTREKRLAAGSIQKIECKKRKKGVLLLPVVESSIHTVNISSRTGPKPTTTAAVPRRRRRRGRWLTSVCTERERERESLPIQQHQPLPSFHTCITRIPLLQPSTSVDKCFIRPMVTRTHTGTVYNMRVANNKGAYTYIYMHTEYLKRGRKSILVYRPLSLARC